MEDYAYVLDYLPQGLVGDKNFRREPMAYGIGDFALKILELIPKASETMHIGDRVYIGKDMELRDKVLHVKRRIGYNDLTSAAQSELPYVIADIIKNSPERFLKFYNEAGAITTRLHMLELIPGLGKKTMWAILDERKKGIFKSFDDVESRVPGVHHPEKLIAKRIEMELSDLSQKYHVFVAR